MKNTTKKPASKTSTRTAAAKKAAPKKPAARTRKPQVGTAAWLIAELQKVPGDMFVLAGDDRGGLFDLQAAEVLPVRNGEIDEDRGEECFCLTGW
jgi:hypothetical protein